jgi:hypothetical protein
MALGLHGEPYAGHSDLWYHRCLAATGKVVNEAPPFACCLTAICVVNPSVARSAPVLRVGAALPDPPFEVNAKDGRAGFDITLMQPLPG